jgi:GT2 family glycosyltransferase
MSASASVIIPSLNSPVIDQVLSAVLEQAGIDRLREVIVVGKDDLALIPKGERVRFIDTGNPVLAAFARNRGYGAANGDILIFLDSDCLPQPGWLEEHLAAHQAGHGVVGGGVMPNGEGFWHLVYNLTLFHEMLSISNPGPRNHLATLNLSVDRTVFQDIGVFDKRIDRVEDIEWTTRARQAGYRPYFWPAAAVRHLHGRRSLTSVWRDCALSGYHMRLLRLRYRGWLQAPRLLRRRRLLLWLSPTIAAWATMRIIRRRPVILRRFPHTLPAIYLTKIAWCWGASRPAAPRQEGARSRFQDSKKAPEIGR